MNKAQALQPLPRAVHMPACCTEAPVRANFHFLLESQEIQDLAHVAKSECVLAVTFHVRPSEVHRGDISSLYSVIKQVKVDMLRNCLMT